MITGLSLNPESTLQRGRMQMSLRPEVRLDVQGDRRMGRPYELCRAHILDVAERHSDLPREIRSHEVVAVEADALLRMQDQ